MARRRHDDHDRDDRHDDHDRDDRRRKRRHPRPKRKHHKPPRGRKPAPPTTTTEKLKAMSKQSGPESMGGFYPRDPANQQAVFTTGPGEAVEYNYVRVDGGAEEYALAQSEQSAPVPPIAGAGQVVTSGAANNPT